MKRAFMTSLLVASTACSGSPTTPTLTHLEDGSWAGTLSDSNAHIATFSFTIVAIPGGWHQGTWQATFPGDAALAGEISVIVDNSVVGIWLRCPGSSGVDGILYQHYSGNHMYGSYRVSLCLGEGTFDVTRQ